MTLNKTALEILKAIQNGKTRFNTPELKLIAQLADYGYVSKTAEIKRVYEDGTQMYFGVLTEKGKKEISR